MDQLAGDHRDHGDPQHPLEQAPEAEPGPVGQPAPAIMFTSNTLSISLAIENAGFDADRHY